MENTNVKEIDTAKINISIPKRSISSIIVLPCTIYFAYIQFIGYVLPGFAEIIKLNPKDNTVQKIGLMWVPVVAYFLICLNICLFVNIFKKLKKYEDKESLVRCLFRYGLLGACLGSCAFILILGSILGSIFGICIGLFVGLIIGLLSSGGAFSK